MEGLDIKEVVQIITGKVIDKIPKDIKIRYKKILSKDGNLKNYFEYGLFLSLWIDESIIMLDSVQGLQKEKRNRYVTLSCKRDNDDLTINEAIELSTLARESSKNIRHSRLAMAESFGIALAPTPSDHRALICA